MVVISLIAQDLSGFVTSLQGVCFLSGCVPSYMIYGSNQRTGQILVEHNGSSCLIVDQGRKTINFFLA